MSESRTDQRVRLAAFEWLEHQRQIHGDVLPWSLLLNGFVFQGTRVPLLSQQGIFKPAVLPRIPLSIRTSVAGPYNDRMTHDDVLLYRYRGTDPGHRDNVGLKKAWRDHVPLVYFFGLMKGRYLPVWPVFIVGADDANLAFSVQVDDERVVKGHLAEALGTGRTGRGSEAHAREPETEIRRAYVTSTFRRRLHQEKFRQRVLRAYREQCAMCRLRHHQLLDAAHIVADSEEEGAPEVRNGLALCKLHHAAFDEYFVGVRPDGVVEVRRDVLEEEDGPMLLHGLQGLHESSLFLPHRKADRPDPALLGRRYERFLRAG